MAPHDLYEFTKSFGAPRGRLGRIVFSQCAHILGNVLEHVPLTDTDEDIPVYAPMQAFVQIAYLCEHAFTEVYGLLQNIVRQVNELPEIERLSGREAALDIAVDIDEISLTVDCSQMRLALEGPYRVGHRPRQDNI